MKFFPLLLTILLLVGCNQKESDLMTTEVSTELPKVDTDSDNKVAIKKDNNMNKQKLEISLTVPDSTWRMAVDSIVENEQECAVIVELEQAEGMMGMQVISELVTAIEFQCSKETNIYVLGKTWGWENEEQFSFIDESQKPQGTSIEFIEVEASRHGGPKKQTIGTPL